MKKILLPAILCCTFFLVHAQAPQAISYQGIARDPGGTPLTDKAIALRLNVHQSTETGNVVYSEVHNLLTNKLGLFNTAIGTGTALSGHLSDINWGGDVYFVEVELDENGGSNFQPLGVSQLLSVPYALYAQKSGDNQWKDNPLGINYPEANGEGNVGIGTTSPTQKLTVSGNTSDGDERIYILAHNKSLSDHSTALIGVSAGADDTRTYINHYSETYGVEGTRYTNYGSMQSTGAGLILSAPNALGQLRFMSGTDGSGHVAERMRIKSNGNIGVGTETPSQKFTIEGNESDGNERILLLARNTSLADRSTSLIGVSAGNDDSRTYLSHYSETYNFEDGKYTDFGQVHSTGAGLILSASSPTGLIKFLTGVDGLNHSAERLRIAANGNIGIGTENPASKLQVTDGDVFIEDVNSGVIMKSPNGSCWRMTINNDGSVSTTSITCPN